MSGMPGERQEVVLVTRPAAATSPDAGAPHPIETLREVLSSSVEIGRAHV